MGCQIIQSVCLFFSKEKLIKAFKSLENLKRCVCSVVIVVHWKLNLLSNENKHRNEKMFIFIGKQLNLEKMQAVLLLPVPLVFTPPTQGLLAFSTKAVVKLFFHSLEKNHAPADQPRSTYRTYQMKLIQQIGLPDNQPHSSHHQVTSQHQEPSLVALCPARPSTCSKLGSKVPAPVLPWPGEVLSSWGGCTEVAKLPATRQHTRTFAANSSDSGLDEG